MIELCDLAAVELRRLIGRREVSPVEVLESCIARIERVDGAVNAVVTRCFERARTEAKAAELAVRQGRPLGLLHGLPIGIKDLEATEGVRTTWGSLTCEDVFPARDQGSVAAVRRQGGIVVGKTNTPEFGVGANTRNRVFGATGNPFDPVKTCGGSSGGSAAALASGMVPLASGSDFGGSLRIPAAFCGVVGFRPSPGVVPSELRPAAVLPYDVIGAMGRTVADAALMLAAQAGRDLRDMFSRCPVEPTRLHPLGEADLVSIRAAVSADLGFAPVAREVRDTFADRAGRFRHLFREAQDRDPPFGAELHEAFEVLRAVIFVTAHRELFEIQRDRLDANLIDNIARGLAYSLDDVARANVVLTTAYQDYLKMFDEVDVVIAPTCAIGPFPRDQLSVTEIEGQAMPTYASWMALTYGLTLAASPVCCIPCGRDATGMPFGIQIAGAPGADHLVLQVAHALERALADDPATARPSPDLALLV